MARRHQDDTAQRGDRDDLLRAYKIGPEDLAANQAGFLTDHQRRILLHSGYRTLAVASLLALGLVAIVVAVADKPLKPVQYILSGLLVVVLLALGSYELRRLRAAAAAGDVECITGPVRVVRRGRAGFYLGVGERDLKLPVGPWHVVNGAAYAVYVAPKAKRIVAMDPAPPPERRAEPADLDRFGSASPDLVQPTAAPTELARDRTT